MIPKMSSPLRQFQSKGSRLVDLILPRIMSLHSPSSDGNASTSGQSSGGEKKKEHVVIDLNDYDTEEEN